MSLRESLNSGKRGLRWSLPPSFEPIEKGAHLLLARDPDRKVGWVLRILPWRFDLRRSHDEALRADVEADARHLFEKAWKPLEWPPGSGKSSPRTADPGWSPVVDFERVHIGEAPALRILRRLTYQPGDEVVNGSLLVPLAEGFAELSAFARAGQTGYRESVLRLKQSGALSTEEKIAFLSQAEYDSPAHDTLFEEHPLSLVRAALRWLLTDAGLEVTAPAALPVEGEQVVEEAGCAVSLPPRYLYVPHEVMPMSPTLASFARVGIADAGVRLLDVWRLSERLSASARSQALERLAVEKTKRWVEEAVTHLEQTAEIVEGDKSAAAVRTFARFKVGGSAKVSAMRWRADEDGTVFRVAVGAGSYVSTAELRDQADAVMASLRRLDEGNGASNSGAPKKPWWKMW